MTTKLEIFSTTSVPVPPKQEIEAFFDDLEEDARRFMPLDARTLLRSSFIAWARDNNRITGLAGCISRAGLQFLHVAIIEEMRGKGLGRALVGEVLNFIRLKHSAIYLSVHEENQPAVRLYESEGFKIIAREPGRFWMIRPTTLGGSALCLLLRILRPLLSLIARMRALRRQA